MNDKGNVLVIGNSGVGKSTLINAVLGEKVAKTSWGTKGTTLKLDCYQGELFNIVDTIGFEPSFFKALKAVRAIKKWSKSGVKEQDKQINVIWFCIDGTSRKLFPQTIKNFAKATAMWESVPIITVITKSYSFPEREENVQLVKDALGQEKEIASRVKDILPVVAEAYVLNETAIVQPEGITELIERTNEIMPEGIKAAQKDINRYNRWRKNALAQSSIVAAAGLAVVKHFANIKIANGTALVGIELTLVDILAKDYGIDRKNEKVVLIKDKITNGTVNTIAKTALDIINKLPIAQRLGSVVINPLLAACVVVVMGEYTVREFEKIYLGEDENEKSGKVQDILEKDLIGEIVQKVERAGKILNDKSKKEDIVKAIPQLFDKETKNRS